VAPILSAHHLSAPVHGGPPALRDVEFELRPGERVLLAGPSGSGKSTLLRALVLLEPCEGEVRLDGEVVGPDRVRELRRRVAWVPQQPVAVAPTVEENLAFARSAGRSPGGGRPGEGRSVDGAARAARQETLMEALGLAKLDRSRRFDRLSGGEQQRLALVRSLIPDPQVLLLDEPTANLDPETVADVIQVVEAWCRGGPGRALVWVSHRASEVRSVVTRSVDVAELQR
jgi:putative ABC transport system ATP-binding protein